MTLIAIEEHFLTPEVRAAWSEAAADDPTSAFDGGEVGRRLDDLGEGRIALMDEMGVDVQVLSLTTPGLHILAPGRSLDLARRTNDRIAEVVARRPDRFQGLAALPTPSPEDAGLSHMSEEREEEGVVPCCPFDLALDGSFVGVLA